MGRSSKNPIISLRGVEKTYTDSVRTTVLRSINFDIFPGEFVAIVGPSGSGKSTLLNILGLLSRYSGGKYFLDGKEVSQYSESELNRVRREIFGFVFQSSYIIPEDSAAGNIALGLRIRRDPPAEQFSAVRSVLNRFGLSHRANVLGKTLSGGERQRVALARAIAPGPLVLLADEPTGSLDSENSRIILEHLKKLSLSGVTVVVITHDPTIAASADRSIKIVDGIVGDVEDCIEWESNINGLLPFKEKIHNSLPNRVSLFFRGFWGEFIDAISNHSSKPARSLLLLIAFLLGAGGLVASVGISESAASQVSERLTAAALDEITYSWRGISNTDPRYDPDSDESGVHRILRLPGVVGVGLQIRAGAGGNHVSLLPWGSVSGQEGELGNISIVNSGFFAINNMIVIPNNAPILLDSGWEGNSAVLGQKIAEDLGISEAGPDRAIWINGQSVSIVGIVKGKAGMADMDNSILLSRSMLDHVNNYADSRFIVRTVPGYPAPVAEAIPYVLSPDNTGIISVQTVADLRYLQRGVASDLGAFIATISWVLLALVTMSAATAMYLSVQSRSAEIALRRALGASRASVWRLFMSEGLAIGLAGGVAGGAVGVVAVVAVCASQGWSIVLNPLSILLGVGAGLVTGALSATYPAFIAAICDPADGIRGG